MRSDLLALDKISGIAGDDPLDYYLARLALEKIPEQVARVKELQALHVRTEPDNKVTKYFEQAAWCYIYGMYDAVAVLSRSVLEFGLKEAFSA